MSTEMITLKLDSKFLGDIDHTVKSEGYHNRTEFIRNTLREKLEKIRLNKAMIEIAKFRGISKKSTSEKEYEEIREKAFNNISRKLK